MAWTLELWVEGPTDASDSADAGEQAGVLPSLVHRTLRQQSKLSEEAYDRAVDSTVRVKWLKDRLRAAVTLPGTRAKDVSGWVRKVLVALAKARREAPGAMLLVFRDCDGISQRLDERDQANGFLVDTGETGQAVAVCVEAVEAWLLADPAAFRQCFGRGPEQGIPGKPEETRDPKSVLRGLIGALRDPEDDDGWSAIYARLAREVDLGTLSDKCTAGYGTFCRDAERLIVPRLIG